MLRKILVFLKIVQFREIRTETGVRKQRRVNPWNPLSYIAFLLVLLIMPVVFTVEQIWEKTME